MITNPNARRPTIAVVVSMLAVLAALAGCSDSRPPEEIVAERAQARLDALVERDFGTAWEYRTPGLREETPRADYVRDMKNRPVRWTGAEIAEVACQAERCEVVANLSYEVPSAPAQLAGMGNTRPVTEIWIRTGGEWWYASNE